MASLTHRWIRELYAVALETRYEDFAQLAMLRAIGLAECTAVLWQSGDGAGEPRRRSVSLDAGFDADRLQSLDAGAPDFAAKVAPWTALLCPVEAVSRRLRHMVAFLRPGTFSEPERVDLAAVAEHLVGAEIVAAECARRFGAPPTASGDDVIGEATCDTAGRILSADQRGRELLRLLDADGDDARLPFSVPAALAVMDRGMIVGGVHVRLRREGDRLLLRLRRERRGSVLSLREIEIAERVARGLTFKEIARELSLAQSTVSTHVYNIYAKLGIRRRSDLVQWLAGGAAVTQS